MTEIMTLRELNGAGGKSVIRLAHGIARGSARGFLLIARPGWTATPVESGAHFDPDDIARITAVTRETSNQLYLVDVGTPDGRPPSAYELSATPTDLERVNTELGLVDILLFPLAGEWAILASDADFFVVMGIPSIAERLLGVTREVALEAFHDYAEGWDPVPRHLSMLEKLDWDGYAQLPAGSTFPLLLR